MPGGLSGGGLLLLGGSSSPGGVGPMTTSLPLSWLPLFSGGPGIVSAPPAVTTLPLSWLSVFSGRSGIASAPVVTAGFPLSWLPLFGGSPAPQLSPIVRCDPGLLLLLCGGAKGISPINPVVIPSDIATILRAIQAAIVAAGIFPRKRCVITLTPEPKPYAGGPQCLIIPGRLNVDQANLSGGGRFTNTVDGEFEIHVIAEQSLDHAQQDTRRLTDPVTGVYAKILALTDLLLLTWPADASGNLLTIEPIRDGGTGAPRMYGKSFGWSGTPNFWQFKYLRAVTQRV